MQFLKRHSSQLTISALLGILLLALFLRTFRLAYSPPRLTHDEMSIGYNAYSILKTGRDEWGRNFPLDFEAFGDHKLPGYIYTLVPFLIVMPLNVITLKIPSIIAGLLIVLAGFFITKTITKNNYFALLTSFLLGVGPWPIHLSRMALESNLALASFSWGMYFLLMSFSSNKKTVNVQLIFPILAGALIGLTTYFYVAYRLIAILVLALTFIFLLKHKLNKKILLIFFISFFIIVLPLASQFLGKSGRARFTQISIFSDEGIQATIQEQQNFCFLSQPKILPKLCRVIYNKPFLYIKTFSKNYLSFLLPTFLFLNGDKLEYLNDPSFAEFYMFLIPFYLVGAFYWFKKKGFEGDLVKYVFLISPIPSALVGDPQIVRGSALLIFVGLFCSTGIIETSKHISKNIYKYVFWVIIGLLMEISLIRFFVSYAYIYPGKYESSFYHLPNEILLFLKENEQNYDTIYIDKIYPDAHIMVAFFNQIDPLWYQENIIRPITGDYFGFSHPTKMGKYEFGGLLMNDLICNDQYEKTLYVTNHNDLLPHWKFMGFSGVHVHAQVYDIDTLRENLKENKTFEKTCLDAKKINE